MVKKASGGGISGESGIVESGEEDGSVIEGRKVMVGNVRRFSAVSVPVVAISCSMVGNSESELELPGGTTIGSSKVVLIICILLVTIFAGGGEE